MKTIKEHDDNIIYSYRLLEENKYKTNIECPNCKNIEMLKVTPGCLLSSMPPQMEIQCPECKRKEFVLA